MEIRKTKKEDIEEILKIYQEAKQFMKEHNNPDQWDDYYPGQWIVEEDITNENGYVILSNNEIVGVFALIFGIDPTYQVIKGKWLNNDSYATIHRIAGKQGYKSILSTAVNYALSKINNVRIDTSEENYVMKNALNKLGFIRCGVINLKNGSPRIAYQLCTKDMKD